MTRAPDTNSGYRSLSKEKKAERIKIMVELRKAGRTLPEIAAAGGVSRHWACKLMKAAGLNLQVVVDKTGRVKHMHGMRYSSEYSTWISMKTRCNDSNHPTYKNYGARGIAHDPRWVNFDAFLEDMGRKPSKGYTLERLDNDKGYFKDNCVWLLKRLQNRNQRTTKLTIEKVREIRQLHSSGGITQRWLAKEYGVSPGTIGMIVNNKKWKEIAA